MKRSEAIEIVREYYPSSGKDLNEALETLIPEIKESEVERIRKELIEHIKDQQSSFISAPDCRDRYEEEENDKYNSWIAWLEKQGEQNLANSAKTCKDEQKFKVGDWVVYNGDICQIVKREEGCNKLVTNFGIEKELVNERNLSAAQPWTIQDVKDGDVLVYEGEIFMIKSYALWNKIVYHCCYDGKFLHKHSIYDSWGREDFDKVQPATEEQRDLLFQKIKEAGYEWDAEKKELKKIEQNPAWSEEDERSIRDSIFYLESAKKYFEKDDSILWDEKWFNSCVDWLKSLKDRALWKPSDEQMEYLAKAITTLGNEGDNKTSAILCELRADLRKIKG